MSRKLDQLAVAALLPASPAPKEPTPEAPAFKPEPPVEGGWMPRNAKCSCGGLLAFVPPPSEDWTPPPVPFGEVASEPRIEFGYWCDTCARAADVRVWRPRQTKRERDACDLPRGGIFHL